MKKSLPNADDWLSEVIQNEQPQSKQSSRRKKKTGVRPNPTDKQTKGENSTECAPTIHHTQADKLSRYKAKDQSKKSKQESKESKKTESHSNKSPSDFGLLPLFEPAVNSVRTMQGKEKGALVWAFQCCTPPLLRVALNRDDSDASAFAPKMQWTYSMFHLCEHYHTDNFTRFIISETPSVDYHTSHTAESLYVEVESVRACPEGFGLCQSDFEAPHRDEDLSIGFDQFCKRAESGVHTKMFPLGPVPVLLVRYMHHAGGKLTNAQLDVLDQHFTGEIMAINAASNAEVICGKQHLAVNERHRVAGRGLFKRSAIYPLSRKEIESAVQPVCPPETCACCGNQGEHMLKCARCSVTHYCNKDCQRRHWKSSHRAVCGKERVVTTDELALVFDAVACKDTGMVQSFKVGTIQQASAPKNIHGDSRFLCKLQPPAGAEVQGSWMCYDEQRSFSVVIPHTTPNIEHALQILREKGIRVPHLGSPSGFALKGFFYAQWEGQMIYIFLDKLAPTQAW